MNVLNKLTKKNLILNKKRTIVTIIGIILSTALIVCVSGMVTSFRKTLANDSINDSGYYHAKVLSMQKEDVNALSNNRNIKDYYLEKEIGYAKIDSKNENKPYMFITAFDKKALENLPVKLIKGRIPENKNEIIISDYLLENGGANYKLGDDITLDIGDRVSYEDGEKHILNQTDSFDSEEEFEFKEKVTYKVVGIMERMTYSFDTYAAPGFTSITYLEENSANLNAYILYKNPRNYDTFTKDITLDKYNYKYNNEYLRYLGVQKSGTMNALYMVAAIVIGIIIVSSVFVIKNSFSISITEKYKMYGMLRSIGATSMQIKKNVLYEGFIIGLIAIPIGILIGVLAVIILILLINLILNDFLGMKFVYSIPFLPIIFSIALASITIYLSTIFIARRAAKITPIDAIRSNNDIKIKSKKLRTPKIINKLFKTGGVIAYKNLKRNKKKYRTTIVSLVVSIFIFISLSSFIEFGFKMAGVYYENIDYNVVVYINEEEKKSLKISEKIRNLEGTIKTSILREASLNLNDNNYSDFGHEVLNLYQDSAPITVVAVGNEEFERFTKQIGVNDNNKGILLDEYQEVINKKRHVGNLYNYKNNDVLKGTTSEGNKSFEINIIRSNEKPMGLEHTYSLGGFLVVSDEIFNNYFKSNGYNLFFKVSNPKEFTESLDNMKKENNYNIAYNNYEEAKQAQNAMVLIVSIFLYGFITVISLIGITNIFNTITTNMNLRSKEFAMFKSIGMTKKEFNRMIRLESIFYGFKSLIIGIPLGLLGSFGIYKAFQGGLDFSYKLPINALIIVIIFVSIIIGIIMKYSLSKINKQNIIETIRNDNI